MRPENPKFPFNLLLFQLAQGLRVPETILPVANQQQQVNNKCYFTFFKVPPKTKAKNEEKLKKIFVFPLTRSKTILGDKKKMKKKK